LPWATILAVFHWPNLDSAFVSRCGHQIIERPQRAISIPGPAWHPDASAIIENLILQPQSPSRPLPFAGGGDGADIRLHEILDPAVRRPGVILKSTSNSKFLKTLSRDDNAPANGFSAANFRAQLTHRLALTSRSMTQPSSLG